MSGRGLNELTDIKKKEVQKLDGMLTTLNWSISKLDQHAFPFYRLLRKKIELERTVDCEEAFESLNKTLVTSPVLTQPLLGETLYLY